MSLILDFRYFGIFQILIDIVNFWFLESANKTGDEFSIGCFLWDLVSSGRYSKAKLSETCPFKQPDKQGHFLGKSRSFFIMWCTVVPDCSWCRLTPRRRLGFETAAFPRRCSGSWWRPPFRRTPSWWNERTVAGCRHRRKSGTAPAVRSRSSGWPGRGCAFACGVLRRSGRFWT